MFSICNMDTRGYFKIPLPTKPLHTNNLHIFNGGKRFKANNIRSQKKASFSAPSQGHLCSRFPGKFNNPLAHWLSTFINNNNSSFNLKSITKWSTAVRSMVFMVLLTRKATWHITLSGRLPPTLQKELLAYILHAEYQNFLPDYIMFHHLKLATFYHNASALTGKLN